MTETRADEWWTPMFASAADLGHERLVARVGELATGVRAGDGGLVDDLVVHAQVLQYRYRARATGYPMWKASTPRLSEMKPRGLATKTPGNPGVTTMNMVVNTKEGIPGFVATTAGFVRRTFDTASTPADGRMLSMSLATLPADLPDDDSAAVVLYGTLQGGVSGLLTAIRDSLSADDQVKHLLRRVIDHEPWPWEPGGWNGD